MGTLKLLSLILAFLVAFPPQLVFGGWKDIIVKVWEDPKETAKYAWSNPGQSFADAKQATVEDWDSSAPTRKAIFADVSAFSAKAWDKSSGVSKEAWDATAQWCAANRHILDDPVAFSKTGWDKTSGVSKEAWDATAEWCSEHSDELTAVVIVVVVIAGAIAVVALTGQSQDGSPYSSLSDLPSVGPGKPFTQSQKWTLLQENMARNNGELRSDMSGQVLFMPKQHTTGYTPPLNEAHVDHIVPKSQGGPNSYGNAQILSREENLLKGSK